MYVNWSVGTENVLNFVIDDDINFNSLVEEMEDMRINIETAQSGYVIIAWSRKHSCSVCNNSCRYSRQLLSSCLERQKLWGQSRWRMLADMQLPCLSSFVDSIPQYWWLVSSLSFFLLFASVYRLTYWILWIFFYNKHIRSVADIRMFDNPSFCLVIVVD